MNEELEKKNEALTEACISMNAQITSMREVIDVLVSANDQMVEEMQDNSKRDRKVVAIADEAIKKAVDIGNKFHQGLAERTAQNN
jgi:hypothetical protein